MTGDPEPQPRTTDAVSVRRITTGMVRERRASRRAFRYVVDDWEDEALPVNAYLVQHPSGRCLFDTGQSAAAARSGYLPRWHPFLRLARFELEEDDEIGAQLTRLGVSPDSVDHVVLSHMHTDHVGGISAFSNAAVVVSETEWQRARGLRGSVRGYVPRHWPRGLDVRPVTMTGPCIGPFPRSHDLLGDGRLLLVETRGHTPGHISLLVRGQRRSWLLAGDLVHDPDDLGERYPAIDRWRKDEEITVLTAHDRQA